VAASSDGDVTGDHGNGDYWLVKLGSGGNLEWQKSLGGKNADYGQFVEQTTDGGYLIAGYSNSNNGDVSEHHAGNDYWVVKTDAEGNIEWEKSLGGSGNDFAYEAMQTSDEGYIVCGKAFSHTGDVTFNHGSGDAWIVKLKKNGSIQWQNCYGGSLDDGANSIRQTSDGGYIAAGATSSQDGDVTGLHGNNDFWIIKLDSAGTLQWQKCLGGSAQDEAFSVRQTADGGYIAAGLSGSSDGDVELNYGDFDYWIVKLDAEGIIQWQRSLGGESDDIAVSIRQTADEKYIVAGTTSYHERGINGLHGSKDYGVALLSKKGSFLGALALGGSGKDEASCVVVLPGDKFIVAGNSSSVDGDISNHPDTAFSDYWIVEVNDFSAFTRQEDNTLLEKPHSLSIADELTLYPNPVSSELQMCFSVKKNQGAPVSVSIFDGSGRKVLTEKITFHDWELPYTLFIKDGLPDGVYLLKTETGNQIFTKQFVLKKK
jgi:hypothetical protein